jgi:L,D-peptidoglycan transpeptidase YkuD (ErfK/YbiS/YcfS/YnhG family)
VARTRLTRLGAVVAALAALTAGCSGGGSVPARSSARPLTSALTSAPSPTATPSSKTPSRRPGSSQRTTSHPARTLRPRSTAPRTTAVRHTSSATRSLPLGFGAGSAREVITVVAPSTGSTEGTLQAWRKVTGGWRRVGGAVHAWLGADGLSAHPSESRSATPIGSFTLTQAFGRDSDPGTTLPYLHTNSADWWISEAGPLYNTHQRCSSGCGFRPGEPNEHLAAITPEYDYAVVIDYNTRNSPTGVRAGAGSAFFLHVSGGEPTAGCVSIARDELVRLLRWLTPSSAPRILIGVG